MAYTCDYKSHNEFIAFVKIVLFSLVLFAKTQTEREGNANPTSSKWTNTR